jgi:hypothetical protein
LKQVFQKEDICVWNTDGIEDFNHESSKFAATMSLILVTVGSLILLFFLSYVLLAGLLAKL